MDTADLNLGADENAILQYLTNFPNEFISVMEISRRAGSRSRFAEDSRWAHPALTQLLDLKLIETDGRGYYRVKSKKAKTNGAGHKFIAPALRELLEKSKKKIDLSNYE